MRRTAASTTPWSSIAASRGCSWPRVAERLDDHRDQPAVRGADLLPCAGVQLARRDRHDRPVAPVADQRQLPAYIRLDLALGRVGLLPSPPRPRPPRRGSRPRTALRRRRRASGSTRRRRSAPGPCARRGRGRSAPPCRPRTAGSGRRPAGRRAASSGARPRRPLESLARLHCTDARTRSGDDSASAADVGQLRAQLEHRLGVDLADPALGDAEHVADLGEREPLVVVEGDHGLLALGQGVDGPGEQPAQLPVLGHLDRVVGGGVLQGVHQAQPVAALAADVQQLLQRHHVRQRQLAEDARAVRPRAMPISAATSHSDGVRRSCASSVA